MQTIWLSPTNFVTGDPTLRVSYPFVSHPSTVVTCTEPGGLKWVSVGLRLPPDVQIEAVIICYEVSNARSFISQVRLAEMTTPDHATVIHDDPAHLTSTAPATYSSAVLGLVPSGQAAEAHKGGALGRRLGAGKAAKAAKARPVKKPRHARRPKDHTRPRATAP